MVGQIGDNVYFIWLFGWFEKALFVLHQSPFFVPQLNYPEGWSLAHTEIVPSVLALGMPVSLLAGPIAAYNVSLLLTFVLSGYFTHLWIRDVSGSSLAGAAVRHDLCFRTVPYGALPLGHLNLASTMWFPLFFWGLLGWLGEEAPQRKHVLLAGVGLGLIALTSMYYFYMTMVVSAIMAAAWLLWSHSRMRRWRFWKQGAQIALVAAPLVALGVLPFWQLEGRGELAARDVQSVTAGSASLSDFLLPSTDHFLWGNWVGEHFGPRPLDGRIAVSRGGRRRAGQPGGPQGSRCSREQRPRYSALRHRSRRVHPGFGDLCTGTRVSCKLTSRLDCGPSWNVTG